MLELRPICEHCAASLPPDSVNARICWFECTFCRACAEDLLDNVCPNCGGGFAPRPVRPRENWHDNNFLEKYPAATERRHRPIDLERRFVDRLRALAPECR